MGKISTSLNIALRHLPWGRQSSDGWSPQDEPQILEWWSADDLSSLTLENGNEVASWVGKKAGLALEQPDSGNRPLYSSSYFGGAPCLVAEGEQWMSMSASGAGFPVGAAPGELWAVCSQELEASTTEMRQVLTYGAAASSQRGIGRLVNLGDVRPMIRTGDGSSALASTYNEAAFMGAHVLRGIFRSANHEVHIDDIGSNSGSVTPDTVATRLRVFANAGSSAGQLWVGGVRHILVVDGELTDGKDVAALSWAMGQLPT